MVVGLCELIVAIPGATSLKQKRSVIRKVIARTQNRFALAIAETDQQDKWQRGTIGFALVGNDRRKIQSLIDSVINFIEGLFLVSIIDVRPTVMNYTPELDERSGFRFD